VRFVLTFLGLFTPLAWLLWIMAGDTPVSPTFETEAPEFGSEPVLDTSEIPQLPVRGEIRRLEKGLFQRFHPEQNYVVYYVSFRGIERVNDKTRIVGISCAVFGEPKDGRENLRARMEAPFLEGDAVALIAAQREGARELVLGGGVKVYDELGRLMAELERVKIDLETDTIASDGDVYFRSPKKGAELRGRGLECDFAFTSARLLRDIRARLPLGDSAVTLTCEGPAIVLRDAAKKKTTVTLENGARIEHQDVAGACDSIVAHLLDSEESGEVEVEKVVLEGAVVFELDASLAEGLEEFRAHRITINGETEIVVEGGEEPVRAVRRGPLELFGLADRVLDFDAPSIVIRLRPDATESKNALESILFPSGLDIRDRAGPGRLHAGWFARGGPHRAATSAGPQGHRGARRVRSQESRVARDGQARATRARQGEPLHVQLRRAAVCGKPQGNRGRARDETGPGQGPHRDVSRVRADLRRHGRQVASPRRRAGRDSRHRSGDACDAARPTADLPLRTGVGDPASRQPRGRSAGGPDLRGARRDLQGERRVRCQ
jgi:hypothetical protein